MRLNFNKFTRKATSWLGSPTALMLALASILIWFIYGLIVGFSDSVQLVANTGTTLITYLMVFVVQASQNRDSQAMQLKLNEIIRALNDTRNRTIALEDCEDCEIEELKKEFKSIRDEDIK